MAEQYTYYASTDRDAGALASLTAACGGTSSFRYSVTGQLDSLLYPNGIVERNTYDGDGLVTRRTIGSGSSSILDDTLQYDPMGRVTVDAGKIARTGASQTIHTVYGGLGAVAVLHTEPSGGTPKLEQFRTDALANRYWSQQYNMTTNANDNPSVRLTNYVGTTQNETWSPNPSTYDDAQHYWYDGAGRLAFKGSAFATWPSSRRGTTSKRLTTTRRMASWC